MPASTTLRLLPATFVTAHVLAYAVTHTDPAHVGHGHGYLGWTAAIGAVLAAQAVWSVHRRREPAVRLGGLVPAAMLLYAVIETGERLVAGGDAGAAVLAPAVLVGIGVQAAVAAFTARAVVVVGGGRAPRAIHAVAVAVRRDRPATGPAPARRSLARPAAPRRGPPVTSIA